MSRCFQTTKNAPLSMTKKGIVISLFHVRLGP